MYDASATIGEIQKFIEMSPSTVAICDTIYDQFPFPSTENISRQSDHIPPRPTSSMCSQK